MIRARLRGKGWWGGVLESLHDKAGNWFSDSIVRKVGNGRDTLFWEDVWVGNSDLKSAFPRLYGLCLEKKCTVAEAGEWVADRWVWHLGWRRELRDWETDTLLNLTALMDCRQQDNDVPDRWEWKLDAQKQYVVRSAYKLLLERKVELNDDFKNPWGNYAVLKAQMTAWRVLLRRIATKVELKRRGVLHARMQDECSICKQAAESTQHLFFECREVANLWSGCLNWIGVQSALHNNTSGNLLQFCSFGSNRSQRVLLASLWTCTIWLIWKYRNDIVFNNGIWKHDKLIGEVKSFLWNWVGAKDRTSKTHRCFNSWCKSPW